MRILLIIAVMHTIAQLVEHCTGIAEVHDAFESRSGLNFFLHALILQLDQ